MKRNAEYVKLLEVSIELSKLEMELNDRLRSEMGEETYMENVKQQFNKTKDFEGMLNAAYKEL